MLSINTIARVEVNVVRSASVPTSFDTGLLLVKDSSFTSSRRLQTYESAEEAVAGLTALGFTVLLGDANFLFFSGEPGLYEALLVRGVLIRDCANYRGLRPGDYRIAVRARVENEALLGAIKEVLHV